MKRSLAITGTAVVAALGALTAGGGVAAANSHETRAYRVAFAFPTGGDAPRALTGQLTLRIDAPNFAGNKAFTGTFDPDQNILTGPDTDVPVSGSFGQPDGGGANFRIVLDPRLPASKQRQVSTVGGQFRADGGFDSSDATYLRPGLGPFATETGVPRTTAGTLGATLVGTDAGPVLRRIAGLSTYTGPVTITDGPRAGTTLATRWNLSLNPATGAVTGIMRLTQGTYGGRGSFEVTGALSGNGLRLTVRTQAPSVPAGQVGRQVLTVTASFGNDLVFSGSVSGLDGDTGTVNAISVNRVFAEE